MKGDKPKWVKKKNGSCENISIGSNCKCWMCKAVSEWINKNGFTYGEQRKKNALKLTEYLAHRMGYTNCKATTLKQCVPINTTQYRNGEA